MKAIAPGKLILSGEHSVVYGEPAIAMAVDRSAVFELIPQEGDQISFDLPGGVGGESYTLLALRDLKLRVERKYREFLRGEIGIREVLTMPVDLFRFAFIHTLDGLHRHVDTGLCLKLRSSIPIGCGMGSSAATVLSEIRALAHYLRVDFKPGWHYEYSLEAEKLQHGTPSGVDSYISLHGGCAYFHQEKARKLALPRMQMFMVQTGTPKSSTGESVMDVKQHFEKSAIWSEFRGITQALEGALGENNEEKIRALIRENHRLLCRIGVVPPKVQHFISDLEQWGGAAKICGAGSVQGEQAGVVLVFANQAPYELCEKYGYEVSSVRGDPLGLRIV